MPYYKFEADDIFYNTIEAHPKSKFLIHDNKTYYPEEIPALSARQAAATGDVNVTLVHTRTTRYNKMKVNPRP